MNHERREGHEIKRTFVLFVFFVVRPSSLILCREHHGPILANASGGNRRIAAGQPRGRPSRSSRPPSRTADSRLSAISIFMAMTSETCAGVPR